MTDIDTGLNAWQMTSNHNRMIDLQADTSPPRDGPVELAYYGSSAFRITSPRGVSVMIDPWRNHPGRKWDWYFHDFPITPVDVGVSTHAHFDHDALHRLDAHVLLDRLIGMYQFGDLTIYGFADKHAVDSTCGLYDFKKIHEHFHATKIDPPDNPRSWDHCLILVETGGLRILHWGDNRHDPPEWVWRSVGDVHVALLPIDGSQHVMGHVHTQAIIERLAPRVVIPHHYYIWNVLQRQSTLLPAEGWVRGRDVVERIEGPRRVYRVEEMDHYDGAVHFFADQVAFDTAAWLQSGR